ncbi:hypothetical protein A1351_05250 [Methylosinus sp. R-45379]|jgi:hypothetical protein|uniref:hypothetical protein n=1 Tax=unclassified Methylosinus TaxID=2624500 RepID=UPI000467D578|nr:MULTISPECIES: hypothetical protein [unclassified Methylosinus]OAI31437.1 hypothetical protein A1351_05250 [Methylosinus sp. R-45379]TDX65257.1 hypothetical protein EDE12_103235 [Methylosinus sp. sav-2]
MRDGAFDLTPTSNEAMFGVRPSAQHEALLASYLLGLGHGPAVVRDLIVADLDGFLDLGLKRRAADQLVVLRAFLARFPEMTRSS